MRVDGWHAMLKKMALDEVPPLRDDCSELWSAAMALADSKSVFEDAESKERLLSVADRVIGKAREMRRARRAEKRRRATLQASEEPEKK